MTVQDYQLRLASALVIEKLGGELLSGGPPRRERDGFCYYCGNAHNGYGELVRDSCGDALGWACRYCSMDRRSLWKKGGWEEVKSPVKLVRCERCWDQVAYVERHFVSGKVSPPVPPSCCGQRMVPSKDARRPKTARRKTPRRRIA